VYVCKWVCVYVHVYIHSCMYVCTHTVQGLDNGLLGPGTQPPVYVCMYVYVCVYMYMYIYMCVYIYIYIYVCMYRHKQDPIRHHTTFAYLIYIVCVVWWVPHLHSILHASVYTAPMLVYMYLRMPSASFERICMCMYCMMSILSAHIYIYIYIHTHMCIYMYMYVLYTYTYVYVCIVWWVPHLHSILHASVHAHRHSLDSTQYHCKNRGKKLQMCMCMCMFMCMSASACQTTQLHTHIDTHTKKLKNMGDKYVIKSRLV
jgi:hypothetical protein